MPSSLRILSLSLNSRHALLEYESPECSGILSIHDKQPELRRDAAIIIAADLDDEIRRFEARIERARFFKCKLAEAVDAEIAKKHAAKS